MAAHWNITVQGLVQGVFYRKYAEEMALKLGLLGFVMNKSDGSVYIEAEGKEEDLQKMVDWCWKGSPKSKVDDVKVKEGELKGFSNFQIHRI